MRMGDRTVRPSLFVLRCASVTEGESSHIAAISALDDGLRSQLYGFVRRCDHPVTRDEAATEAGISRKLAAFHLDKLVELGLLRAEYRRHAGLFRTPGRAPKVYSPSNAEIGVTIPPRRYEFVAEILVQGVERAEPGHPAREVVLQVAAERGEAQGKAIRGQRSLGRVGAERAITLTREILEETGFEPALLDGTLLLRNCPFHRLAQASPELICGLNQAFVQGLLDGLGNQSVATDLVPSPEFCCVRLRPSE